MRSGPAASGVDTVETETRPRSTGRMGTAVVLREHLDVPVMVTAIDVVLDAKVGEVHAIIEVRQFVVLRPSANLFVVAVRPPVTIGPVAVVVLEEGLVIPLEVLFEDDTADFDVSVLLSETGSRARPSSRSRTSSHRASYIAPPA